MKKIGRNLVDPATVKAEGLLLKQIWDAHPDKHSDGQEEFGLRFQIGNQSAVSQCLLGKMPLSLKAAKGFAKGLGCQIADFSARLAELETAWPFELVDRERYEALPPAQRHRAQLRMMDEIEDIESSLKANGTYR